MRTVEQRKAHKLQVQAREHLKADNKAKSSKKANDRTMIQGGGILSASELFDFFGIEVGEDLQTCLIGNQKSATLLGALLELNALLRRRSITEAKLIEWQDRGMKYLAERKGQKNKIANKINSTREEQTRTKIQGGGLLIVSGLFDFFEIEVGEDLQTVLDGCQKSATLLGALVELRRLLEDRGVTSEQKRKWKSKGAKVFVGRNDG